MLICDRWYDGLGQTGSSVLWFVGMNLLVQNHNHYTTTKAIERQEREIEGMLCWRLLTSQKQCCTEPPLFLFLCRMVELVQGIACVHSTFCHNLHMEFTLYIMHRVMQLCISVVPVCKYFKPSSFFSERLLVAGCSHTKSSI